ncbi:short chain dehydrogenase [Chitinophaga sp. Cy-1792]|uniref:short chain dehydrogenase n=1 Tax=Chitinophaga sp. Cy-1792 TaxID=2608339 RepID=UPI0014218B36|nr:short chain dehydrogenase [Chitinophaga sp. Cy-1792]NIG54698.1 short chain dehydrogenase [Chitinophaga sp. Cy-1792]
MKILIIGANGTIGKKLTPQLSQHHTIITAGRNSGDIRVDVSSETSIKAMFEQVTAIDACICIAASGPLDDFSTLTEQQLSADLKGKLFGQINLVLIGQKYLNNNGCFTLTSGIFADIPYRGVTGGAITSGALHSFVLSAAIELQRGLRINVVSPGMAEDSAADYGHLFPGLKPVSMQALVDAYEKTINEDITGQILRVY